MGQSPRETSLPLSALSPCCVLPLGWQSLNHTSQFAHSTHLCAQAIHQVPQNLHDLNEWSSRWTWASGEPDTSAPSSPTAPQRTGPEPRQSMLKGLGYRGSGVRRGWLAINTELGHGWQQQRTMGLQAGLWTNRGMCLAGFGDSMNCNGEREEGLSLW